MKKVSGFYYDYQTENDMLSVTLHPNTQRDANNNWVRVSDPEEEELATYTGHFANENEEPWKYSKTPIMRSITSEDFQVSITNHWSDFGSDMIGDAWNASKPMAPYLSFVAGKLKEIGESSRQVAAEESERLRGEGKEDNWKVKFDNGLATVTELLSSGLSARSKYKNRSLNVMGTRFAYYNGTDINFSGNLVMRYTIFPKIVNGEWIDVNKQVNSILPWVVGDYVPLDVQEIINDNPGMQNVVDFAANNLKMDVNGAKDWVSKVASWQFPPGGFESDLKSVDNVQKGTLKLRIGTFYSIENLVIDNANFIFSKSLVKNPQAQVSRDALKYTSPLYCEVTLVLRPASKYSRNAIANFAEGRSSQKYRSTKNRELINNVADINMINSGGISVSSLIGNVTNPGSIDALQAKGNSIGSQIWNKISTQAQATVLSGIQSAGLPTNIDGDLII